LRRGAAGRTVLPWTWGLVCRVHWWYEVVECCSGFMRACSASGARVRCPGDAWKAEERIKVEGRLRVAT
jgi:hypothetical protein